MPYYNESFYDLKAGDDTIRLELDQTDGYVKIYATGGGGIGGIPVTITEPLLAGQVLTVSNNQFVNAILSHNSLSDIGTNSHTVIDTFITSKGSPGGIAPLNNDGLVSSDFLPSDGLTEKGFTLSSTPTETIYVDGQDNTIVYAQNTVKYPPKIVSITSHVPSGSSPITISSYNNFSCLSPQLFNSSNASEFVRLNIKYEGSYAFNEFFYSFLSAGSGGTSVNVVNFRITVYGSNFITAYNDTTNNTTGLTLLLNEFTAAYNGVTLPISNTDTFKYIHVFIRIAIDGVPTRGDLIYLYLYRAPTGVKPLVSYYDGVSADYQLNSNPTTGAPIIYWSNPAVSATYDLIALTIRESFRRIYPVVRETNAIKLNQYSISQVGTTTPLSVAYSTTGRWDDGKVVMNVDTTGMLSVGSGVKLYNSAGTIGTSYSITLQAPVLSSNSVYTLPSVVGTNGQLLTTNSSGVWNWVTPSLSLLTGDVNITGNPVEGDILRFTNGKWTNRSDFTNLSNLVTPVIRDSNTIVLQDPNNYVVLTSSSIQANLLRFSDGLVFLQGNTRPTGSGQVLTSFGVDAAGWVAPQGTPKLTYDKISFVFPLTTTGGYQATIYSSRYVCYIEGAGTDYPFKMPPITTSGKTVYVQFIGNNSYYFAQDPRGYMFGHSDHKVTNKLGYLGALDEIANINVSNSTYKLTYRNAYENPYISWNAPTWQVDYLGNPSIVGSDGNIPLDPDVDVHLFLTLNTVNGFPGLFSLPNNLVSGRTIYFKDFGLNASLFNIHILSTNNNLLEVRSGSVEPVVNYSYEQKLSIFENGAGYAYTYIGEGQNGYLSLLGVARSAYTA